MTEKNRKTIKALTFDTGGTILDWHSGISDCLKTLGDKHDLSKDWTTITNDYRLRTLMKMTGGADDFMPDYNMDDVLKSELEDILAAYKLDSFTKEDREAVFKAWHSLPVWEDVPSGLKRLRQSYTAASLTILSVRMIINTCKPKDIVWDAVFSCETIGMYKPRSKPYKTAAHWLQLDPGECLMVAAHMFDLEAAAKAGFQTAFIERPLEWGPGEAPSFTKSDYQPDIVAKDFNDLADQLGC